MAKTFGLQSRKATWEAQGDAVTVLSKLLDAASQLGGSVPGEADGLVEMKFGSRFNYRMLGVLSKPPKRPLMLRLNVEPKSATTAEVQVDAFSDPGWYATTALLKRFGKQYEEAFRRIFDGLHAAFPAVSDG